MSRTPVRFLNLIQFDLCYDPTIDVVEDTQSSRGNLSFLWVPRQLSLD